MRKLTHKEVEELFLELWWAITPETYETLWVEGIGGDVMIGDCAQVYPGLYKKLLNTLEEEAKKRGIILP